MEAEWSEDKEKRLQYVQRELHESQKRWSDGQELWVEEVEALLELRRVAKIAEKRRIKEQKKEARRLSRGEQDGVALGERDVGESIFARRRSRRHTRAKSLPANTRGKTSDEEAVEEEAERPDMERLKKPSFRLLRRMSSRHSEMSTPSTRTSMDPSRVNSIPGTPDNTKRRTSLGFGALLRRFTSKGKASEIED